MVSDDEMSGIFHAVVRTAEGHTRPDRRARADRGRGKQHGPDLRQPGRVAPASTVAQPTS
jgi:hypothetical protein